MQPNAMHEQLMRKSLVARLHATIVPTMAFCSAQETLVICSTECAAEADACLRPGRSGCNVAYMCPSSFDL